MDKITITKKEFDELYTITDTQDLPSTPEVIDKPETILTEEEEIFDKTLEEEFK